MKEITNIIIKLRAQLERHGHSGLKEYPTRTIFIDPMLTALGWDVRDPDDVELEYPTVDSKSVDYALKINRKPIILLEAKQLTDNLDDMKSITQVVGYAANDGIEWCVLTNGIRYRVYKTTEKAAAPDKLLYEVSIDPADGVPVEQIEEQLLRLSRDSMAQGVLDKLGSEIFITAKVRKALDKLFTDGPQPLIRLVRNNVDDDKVSPSQIQQALRRIWNVETSEDINNVSTRSPARMKQVSSTKEKDSTESHHTDGKPSEVIELYRELDRLCHELAPGRIVKNYKAWYIRWSIDKEIFCCAHLQQGGMRVWVKTNYKDRDPSDTFVRDVAKLGHWGVGDVELAIDSRQRLQAAKKYIQDSFKKVSNIK